MEMVDMEKIQQKIFTIEENLRKLEKLKAIPEEQFFSDFRNIEATKHLLQIAIEAMTDICTHILAKKRLGIPDTKATCFQILVKNKLLDAENAQEYIKMIKFRNRVVHLYGEVNEKEVYMLLQDKLDDFRKYLGEIAGFINENKL